MKDIHSTQRVCALSCWHVLLLQHTASTFCLPGIMQTALE
jgi:hypothetical protein